MKTRRFLFAVLAALAVSRGLLASEITSSGSDLRPILPPPDVVLRHAEALSLTAEQHRTLTRQADEFRAAFRQLYQRVQVESQALAQLAAKDRPDEAAVLAQLERVLAAESEAKRFRVKESLRARAQLTPEQQASLRKLVFRPAMARTPEDIEARVASKLERLKEMTERRRQQGHDLAELRGFSSRVDPLLESGRWAEAEQLVDQALAEFSEVRPALPPK